MNEQTAEDLNISSSLTLFANKNVTNRQIPHKVKRILLNCIILISNFVGLYKRFVKSVIRKLEGIVIGKNIVNLVLKNTKKNITRTMQESITITI